MSQVNKSTFEKKRSKEEIKSLLQEVGVNISNGKFEAIWQLAQEKQSQIQVHNFDGIFFITKKSMLI